MQHNIHSIQHKTYSALNATSITTDSQTSAFIPPPAGSHTIGPLSLSVGPMGRVSLFRPHQSIVSLRSFSKMRSSLGSSQILYSLADVHIDKSPSQIFNESWYRFYKLYKSYTSTWSTKKFSQLIWLSQPTLSETIGTGNILSFSFYVALAHELRLHIFKIGL